MSRFSVIFDVSSEGNDEEKWKRAMEIVDFGNELMDEVSNKFNVDVTDSGFGFGARDYMGDFNDEVDIQAMFAYIVEKSAASNMPIPVCQVYHLN